LATCHRITVEINVIKDRKNNFQFESYFLDQEFTIYSQV